MYQKENLNEPYVLLYMPKSHFPNMTERPMDATKGAAEPAKGVTTSSAALIVSRFAVLTIVDP
jgi:hypothetical protein